jgi:hypothetical protein
VDGTFDSTNLTIQSQPFSVMQARQSITRQFRLEGMAIQNGDVITGTYRETVWGFMPQPSTVVGRFGLARTVFYTPTPDEGNPPLPNATNTPDGDFFRYPPRIHQ